MINHRHQAHRRRERAGIESGMPGIRCMPFRKFRSNKIVQATFMRMVHIQGDSVYRSAIRDKGPVQNEVRVNLSRTALPMLLVENRKPQIICPRATLFNEAHNQSFNLI
ncbi:hypothetical protein PoB_003394100 [Plakobranchus ocellatus]|uniref:Uncharacterized protein n=1 Tax=Plakobranchus ocellatus TaxID=259542 RepID=A0AAV4A887_9GAST|nr:hypothetical protein PoB_003394100 [Plakobranchus ocellatus]